MIWSNNCNSFYISVDLCLSKFFLIVFKEFKKRARLIKIDITLKEAWNWEKVKRNDALIIMIRLEESGPTRKIIKGHQQQTHTQFISFYLFSFSVCSIIWKLDETRLYLKVNLKLFGSFWKLRSHPNETSYLLKSFRFMCLCICVVNQNSLFISLRKFALLFW